MDRAGKMVAVKEDSYKRVYADDGKSYTYPKIAENRLRVKGQLYFQNRDITGSKENDIQLQLNDTESILWENVNYKYSVAKLYNNEIENKEAYK